MENSQALTLGQVKDAIQSKVKSINVELTIENIWLDLGAGISGENIIVHKGNSISYQLLHMNELDSISGESFTSADVQQVVDRMLARGW